MFNTEECFYCFYTPLILTDSVYRKGENYYSKVCLEKFINNLFWRSNWALEVPPGIQEKV